jgi:hypothetical protein
MENKETSMILSHIFKKGLYHLLSDGDGLVIKLENKIKPLFPNVENVIIFKDNDEIKIIPYDGDLNDGDFIKIDLE